MDMDREKEKEKDGFGVLSKTKTAIRGVGVGVGLRPSLASSFNNPVIRQSKLLLLRLDILNAYTERYEEFRDLCSPDVRHISKASQLLFKCRTSIARACVVSYNYLTSNTYTDGFPSMDQQIPKLLGNGSIVNHPVEGMTCDLHPVTGNILHCCKELGRHQKGLRGMLVVAAELELELDLYTPHEGYAVDRIPLVMLENLLAGLEVAASRFDLDLFKKHRGEKHGEEVERESNDDTMGTRESIGGIGGGRETIGGPGSKRRRSMNLQTHSLHDSTLEDRIGEAFIKTAQRHLFLTNNLFAISAYGVDKRKEIEAQTANSYALKRPALPRSITTPIGAVSGERGGRGGRGEGLSKRAVSRRFTQANSSGSGNATKDDQWSAAFVIFLDRLDELLLIEQSQFCEAVGRAMALGVDDMQEFKDTMQVKGDKNLNLRNRALKAKFTIFNTGLEALLARQGEWRVINVTLRNSLTAQLIRTVLPVYSDLYTTYSDSKFSKKHIEDYLKFTPQQVETNLRTFFGKG